MNDSRLRAHLVREHGRSGPDVAVLPVADLHHFEHVVVSLGLITLGHRHSPDGPGRRPDSPEC
jgi:hypothetical protein